MRLSSLVAALVLATIGFSCVAHATGNVLVPTEDKPLPAPAPAAPSLPELDPKASPPPASGTTAANPYLSGGKTQPLQTTTHVIQMPAPEVGMSTPADTDQRDGMIIDIDDKASWGNSDIDIVSHALGMQKESVPEHCHFSMAGLIETDAGAATFSMPPSGQRTITYVSGKPTSTSVNLAAMCDLVNLPANAGYIMRIGDKYSIFVRQVSCAPPPPHAQHMVFHYAGDGKGSCTYQ